MHYYACADYAIIINKTTDVFVRLSFLDNDVQLTQLLDQKPALSFKEQMRSDYTTK